MVPLHANSDEEKKMKKEKNRSLRLCCTKTLAGHSRGMSGRIQATCPAQHLEDALKGFSQCQGPRGVLKYIIFAISTIC